MRAIMTGIFVGALLTPCNVYSGLKIGWSFNMSIIAALLGYAFWKVAADLLHLEPWSLQENTYNQTTASAAASIISGGLVAPIPAYTLLTGDSLAVPILIFWVFSVSFLGVLVAVGLRQQLLMRDHIPFPSGIATAESITDLHGSEKGSRQKITGLFVAGGFSFAVKLINDLIISVPSWPIWQPIAQLYVKLSGIKSYTLQKASFFFDPSLLLLGFGLIIGTRAGLSLLLGAIISWLIVPPMLLATNAVALPDVDTAFWFADLVTWTLWPGVGLMVVYALTLFSFSLGRLLTVKKTHRIDERPIAQDNAVIAQPMKGYRRLFIASIIITLVVLSMAQWQIFNIPLLMGVLAVLASMLLGIVSSRVSGETGIPPIGALGKVTQLSFGLLNPGHIAANLMTANVTGGAAGQSSDLLHDLKAGLLLKVNHHLQVLAQVFGIMTGAFVGSLVYLLLIPDPQSQLITPEWPAPAVATWKAVAELMAQGVAYFPSGALEALFGAGLIGLVIALLEQYLPAQYRRWLPSASAMGLAFIIPASLSLTLFAGAMLALLLKTIKPSFAQRYTVVIAAGLVAGESFGGLLAIVWQAF
jgi:OPT family oligopeptide transporter